MCGHLRGQYLQWLFFLPSMSSWTGHWYLECSHKYLGIQIHSFWRSLFLEWRVWWTHLGLVFDLSKKLNTIKNKSSTIRAVDHLQMNNFHCNICPLNMIKLYYKYIFPLKEKGERLEMHNIITIIEHDKNKLELHI